MYYIKLKGCYDARGFIDIRVAMITKLRRHYVFYLGLYFSVPGFFFGDHFRLLVPPMTDSIVEKFEQILCEHFGWFWNNVFMGHKQ